MLAAPFLASTKHSLGFYPLFAAVLSGAPEIVHIILAQRGVRVSSVKVERDDSDDDGSSSSDNNDSDDSEDDSFRFLRTEFSSNPRHRVVRGATALHYACMSNNQAIVWAICQKSVDFHQKDSRGKVPVDYIDSSSSEGIEVLRIYGSAYEEWQRKRKAFNGSESCNLYTFSRQTQCSSCLVALRNAAEAIFRKDPELFKS